MRVGSPGVSRTTAVLALAHMNMRASPHTTLCKSNTDPRPYSRGSWAGTPLFSPPIQVESAPFRKGTEGHLCRRVGLNGWSVWWTAPMKPALVSLCSSAGYYPSVSSDGMDHIHGGLIYTEPKALKVQARGPLPPGADPAPPLRRPDQRWRPRRPAPLARPVWQRQGSDFKALVSGREWVRARPAFPTAPSHAPSPQPSLRLAHVTPELRQLGLPPPPPLQCPRRGCTRELPAPRPQPHRTMAHAACPRPAAPERGPAGR